MSEQKGTFAMPTIGCGDPDATPGSRKLMDLLNVMNVMFNAQRESSILGYDSDETMKSACDHSLCTMSYAASHIALEGVLHIKDHEGFECAKSIVDAYTAVFHEMLTSVMSQAIEDGGFAENPFHELSHNEQVMADIMAQIKGEEDEQGKEKRSDED